jgi:hypothetical protein
MLTDLRVGDHGKEPRKDKQPEQHLDRCERTRDSPEAAVELIGGGELQLL